MNTQICTHLSKWAKLSPKHIFILSLKKTKLLSNACLMHSWILRKWIKESCCNLIGEEVTLFLFLIYGLKQAELPVFLMETGMMAYPLADFSLQMNVCFSLAYIIWMMSIVVLPITVELLLYLLLPNWICFAVKTVPCIHPFSTLWSNVTLNRFSECVIMPLVIIIILFLKKWLSFILTCLIIL